MWPLAEDGPFGPEQGHRKAIAHGGSRETMFRLILPLPKINYQITRQQVGPKVSSHLLFRLPHRPLPHPLLALAQRI